MRFHILGLSHTKTNADYVFCAFTQKVVKMIRMLQGLGHEVVHYGAEGSDVGCEHVQVLSHKEQMETYGQWDYANEQFTFGSDVKALKTFNVTAVAEIRRRKQKGDFLLIPFGNFQQDVARGADVPLTVESGIGYPGICTRFRVFESYAWMHTMYGMYNIPDGHRWYDAVIPNAFDPLEFTFRSNKDGYFCMLARLNKDKGVQTAIDVSRALGKKLFIAGQGNLAQFNVSGADIEHVGTVNKTGRDKLLGGAEAVFLPTEYIEPFGGAAVEAQFCGTPVITTDWGAFPETVVHGVTGYRCRTMDDFLFAGRNARNLDASVIRKWAIENFSLARVARMYQEYFTKLADLDSSGWYTERPERLQLDWLKVSYPS